MQNIYTYEFWSVPAQLILCFKKNKTWKHVKPLSAKLFTPKTILDTVTINGDVYWATNSEIKL